jgi:proteic killer suppression protein
VNLHAKAKRQLDQINAAVELTDLKIPPGNKLEALKGDLAAYHSIRINDQWRIIFIWRQDGSHNVAILDYHR